MISVIITAKNEARTIGRAVKCFLEQKLPDELEIVVVAPDDETLAAVRGRERVAAVKDKGESKGQALNLAISQAKGEKLIFSDGDVEIAQNAVAELLAVKADLVGGRPIGLAKNKLQQDKFDFWQKFLFDQADRLRRERSASGGFMLLSGYLFLAERKVFDNFQFPRGLLTEDEYLSYYARQAGYTIKYAPAARVRVRFLNNRRDFIRQKTRTLGGRYQIPPEWKGAAVRSLAQEAVWGCQAAYAYARSPRQLGWLAELFALRLYTWLLAWFKVKLLKWETGRVWQRVESSK